MMNEKRIFPTRIALAVGLVAMALIVFSVCPAGAEPLILPTSTTRIEEEAFFGDTSIEEVVLHDRLSYIGPRAFAGTGLKLVTFPAVPIDIAQDAFADCEDVQALVVADSWAQQWCEEHGIPWLTPPVFDQDMPIVKNGADLQIELDSPHSADARYTWSSDNESVLTVDEGGLVFGEYPGTVNLTVTLPCGHEPLQIPVRVQANYRAVLFSESTYRDGKEKLFRNRGDVLIMTRLLASVTGPDGGRYTVTSYDDLPADQVFQMITQDLEIPSREGDVSMFFFASHGDPTSKDQQNAGRMWCINRKTWIALPDLANALVRVKGKVIVILEACGPGAAIHDFGLRSAPKFAFTGVGLRASETVSTSGSEEAEDEIPPEVLAAYESQMTGSMLSAFSAVDPGLSPAPSKPRLLRSTNLFIESGEKFAIMCAAGYLEYSKVWHERYGNVEGSANVFPYFIGQGVGTSGPMPADTDGDGILTLNELHLYTYEKSFKYTTYRNENNVLVPGQKTCVWPEGSSYPLFMRYTPATGQ